MNRRTAGQEAHRLLATVLLALGLVVLSASPAHAHAADADRATNYETSVVSVPDVEGLAVSAIDAGTTLELTYTGDGEIIVLGYAGEPYLRISPSGVDENTHSDATYLNRSLTGTPTIPPEADPDAAPEWSHVSDEPVARWHDHRAHWMGAIDPPAVKDAPDERHVVMDDQEIPLLIGGLDGEEAAIVVDITWVPGPGPWVWAAGLVLAVAGIALAGRSRRAEVVLRVVGIGLVLTGIAALVASIGAAVVSPPFWWTTALVLATTAVAVGLVLHRRHPGTVERVLLGIGGLALAGLIGGIDRAWLVRSQLPVSLDPSIARLLIVSSLSLGLGLAALVLVTAFRRPVDPPAVGPVG